MTCAMRVIRGGAFSALLSLAVYTGSGQTRPAQMHDPSGTELAQTIGISNFAEVTPHLYRSGQPDDAAFADLKKIGIEIIVDMRSGNRKHEKRVVTQLGMRYVQISWHCPFPSDKPFAEFLKIVEDNPKKKILVHCRLGDDRTGMAVAAYRMAEQGWSADEAMSEMHQFGFGGVHYLICPGLAGYEKSFPERLKKDAAFEGMRRRPDQSK